MKLNRRAAVFVWPLLSLSLPACISGPEGVQGSSATAEASIEGTVFTIVLENEDASVLEEMPYLTSLAARYSRADAYYSDHHPSLPNYLLMVSGSDQGVSDDDGPERHPIDADNLTVQLDDAGIPWRAYMEDMGEACGMADKGQYAVRHDPFVYFTSVTSDPEYCREHVVDMAANLQNDLANNAYRYVWITPNTCNDMHDCPAKTADDWLSRVIPQIMSSEGYRNGGAIFVLWDEGGRDASYVFGGKQNIPAVVISEELDSPGYVSGILYDHRSYLATVEDTLGMKRLSTTRRATPMADLFDASRQIANPAITE